MTSNVGAELLEEADGDGFRRTERGTRLRFDARQRFSMKPSASLNPSFSTGWTRSSCFIRSVNRSCCASLIWKWTKCSRASKPRTCTLSLTAKREGISHRQRIRSAVRRRDRCVALSERFLEDPLAEELLRGNVKPGDRVERRCAPTASCRSRFRNHRHKAAHQRRRRELGHSSQLRPRM